MYSKFRCESNSTAQKHVFYRKEKIIFLCSDKPLILHAIVLSGGRKVVQYVSLCSRLRNGVMDCHGREGGGGEWMQLSTAILPNSKMCIKNYLLIYIELKMQKII